MDTLGPHELACLREDDSWQLFSNKAFGNGVEEQVELVTIGRRIIKKCRGLPLALKTMGGLMSSKQQVWEWEDIENSNIGDNDRGKDEVLSILKLSYRHLTCEMKQCFAFCAVFPKDYEMEKDILIQLWMANGFLQEEVTMDLAQKGELIFNYLVWRSFLQDVKVKKFERHNDGISNEYGSTVCKMHDLMHDLGKHVADECATVQELVQQKVLLENVRHLQIAGHEWDMSKPELEHMSGLFRTTTSLCTLLRISGGYEDLKELNMMSLRALCCDGYYITNSQIKSAKHLRYLDLSHSYMVRLPDSVCMLYSLQTLRLNGCQNLQLLPEGISAMRKLIHLYLLGCPRLEWMPPNISLLNNLRTLTTSIVDTEVGHGIEELKDLQHLCSRLELYNLRRIKSGSNAKEANLHQKQNIGELLMCWGHRKDDMPGDESCNAEQVLESLAPHGKLKILEVHGYGGLEIPEWMKDPNMFWHLRKFTISNCPRCKDLSMVWLSDSLEYMCVENMGSLSTLCKSSTDVEAEGYNTPLQSFPKLKKMVLRKLPMLERWTESSAREPNSLVMFPVLEKLEIMECQSLPISSLAHLMKLSEFEYDGTCFVPASMPLGSWESFSFVEELTINRCSGLVRWPVEELRSLAGLQSLCIAFCENLEGTGSSSSEETLPLPHLERLFVSYCDSLTEIPKLPASLQHLKIYGCQKLEALPCNLGDLADLWLLHINGCGGLTTLADGMDGLTSLERLMIEFCPGIVEFPRGLLRRLSALKSLSVVGCPDLEKRCREGGEYFHLLSSVPEIIYAYGKSIEIETRTESSMKKLVRRLLPSCADSLTLIEDPRWN